MASKLSERVDELRDRAAETISADGASLFRALRDVTDRIDDAEANLQERLLETEASLAATEATLADRLDDLAAQKRRTTWPRRLFWLLLGASIVASVFVSAPKRAKDLHDTLLG